MSHCFRMADRLTWDNLEEMGGKIRAINVTLYDFEDYIEPDTYEKSKFVELETATRDLALGLVEHITTFTTQSALDPLPASKFPALPPLPPLPPGANMSRPDSRMTARTNPRSTVSQPDMVQRRPSQRARSDSRDEYSRQFQGRSAAYSDSSPVSTTPGHMPFSPQGMGEQDRMRNEHWQREHRRQQSNTNSNALPMLMDRMDIGILTPPSSVVAPQTSPYYQGQGMVKGRGPNGYPFQHTPPASDTAESQGYPFPPEPLANRMYMSPMSPPPMEDSSMLANEYSPQRHFDNRSEGSGELLQRESLATQTYSFTERSDGSNEPLHTKPASISSGTARSRTGGSTSGNSVHQSSGRLSGNEIGSQSTINALGSFCKGARNFASAGPGRAIKRVGAMEGQGGATGPKSQEFSQEMLFGSMLGATGGETSSDPTAQCQSCAYKTLYSNLRQDIEQDRKYTSTSSSCRVFYGHSADQDCSIGNSTSQRRLIPITLSLEIPYCC